MINDKTNMIGYHKKRLEEDKITNSHAADICSSLNMIIHLCEQNNYKNTIALFNNIKICISDAKVYSNNTLLRKKIEEVGKEILSLRTRNCLAYEGNYGSVFNSPFIYLGDLVIQHEAKLLCIRNFGKSSLREVKNLLDRYDLRLGMNIDWDRPKYE